MNKTRVKSEAKVKAKAQAKTKSAGKEKKGKAAKRTVKSKRVNPADVRKDVTDIVGGGARKLTRKMLDEAVGKGQLATMKYLFEVAGVFPPLTEGDVSRPEDDTLAQRLLRRMGLPDGPLPNSEDDDPPEELAGGPAKSGALAEDKSAEGNGGVDLVEIATAGEVAD